MDLSISGPGPRLLATKHRGIITTTLCISQIFAQTNLTSGA